MSEHPNASVVRRMYAALTQGDYVAALEELLSDNVVWHLPGHGPLAGDHAGREAVLSAMRRFEELSGGSIRVELHDVLANDIHAVALLRATGTRGARHYDALEADVFHLENRRITEFWSLSQDQRSTDEFWSSPPYPWTSPRRPRRITAKKAGRAGSGPAVLPAAAGQRPS